MRRKYKLPGQRECHRRNCQNPVVHLADSVGVRNEDSGQVEDAAAEAEAVEVLH